MTSSSSTVHSNVDDLDRRSSTDSSAFGFDFEQLTSPPPPPHPPPTTPTFDLNQDQGIDPELERLLEYDPGLMDMKARSLQQFGERNVVYVGGGAVPPTWYSLPPTSNASAIVQQPPQPPVNVVEQVRSEYLPKPDNR